MIDNKRNTILYYPLKKSRRKNLSAIAHSKWSKIKSNVFHVVNDGKG